MFGNLHWKVNTILTALLIPGGAFSVFFIINICLELEGSSEAVSFTTLLKLLFLWLGISLPLIYVGSLSGFKKEEIANPCKINRIPRMIPLAADSGSLNLISLAAGALPFGCMLIEITYVM